MRELSSCLFDYHPAMLEIIAQHWGIELTVADKRDAIMQLTAEMLQPDAANRMLESLSTAERAALDELIAARAGVKAVPFMRRHGEIRSFGPGSLRREQPWRAPASPVESLWYRGLVYKGFAKLDDYIGEVLFIPADLLALLPTAAPPPLTLNIAPTHPPARPRATSLIWDIFALLTYLQRESIHPTADGSLRKAAQQDILARMVDKDAARLDFAYYLTTALNLVELKDGLLKPSSAARRWLKASSAARRHATRIAWRASEWDELCHITALQCEPADKRQSDPRDTRNNFLNLLAQCPAQEWLSCADFIRAVKDAAPDFQRLDGNYKTWYIRDIATDKFLVGFENWDAVEGRLIAYYLTKPLAWLEIVELGYDEDTVTSFRVTPSGQAFLLRQDEQTTPAPAPALLIHEDFIFTVPAGFGLYDHFQLERLADRLILDQVERYRLSRDRVEAIFRQEIEVDNILTFLHRVSHDRVPAIVTQTLRQWAAKYEAITMERVILLRAWDAMTMQELRAAPQLQPYLGAPVDELRVIVTTDDMDKVTALLRELGYWAQIKPCGAETP